MTYSDQRKVRDVQADLLAWREVRRNGDRKVLVWRLERLAGDIMVGWGIRSLV